MPRKGFLTIKQFATKYPEWTEQRVRHQLLQAKDHDRLPGPETMWIGKWRPTLHETRFLAWLREQE